MDLSASHAGFVIGAYALSAILLAGLVAIILLRDAKLRGKARRHEPNRRWEDTR